MLAASTTMLVFVAATGCSRSKQAGPFSDVTDAERNESTLAVAPPDTNPTVSADTITTDATSAQPSTEVQQPQVIEPTVMTKTQVETTTDTPVKPADDTTTQTPPPPARQEQPAIVPPTETIRAETPSAAGPATSAVVNGGARYQIIASSPSIVPTTQPVETTLEDGTEIPLEIDDVGLIRQWPLQVVERPSGNTVAFPTYWPSVERQPRRSELSQAFVEPVEFLVNTVMLPFRMIVKPPWTRVLNDPAIEQDEPHAPYELQAPPPTPEQQRQEQPIQQEPVQQEPSQQAPQETTQPPLQQN